MIYHYFCYLIIEQYIITYNKHKRFLNIINNTTKQMIKIKLNDFQLTTSLTFTQALNHDPYTLQIKQTISQNFFNSSINFQKI